MVGDRSCLRDSRVHLVGKLTCFIKIWQLGFVCSEATLIEVESPPATDNLYSLLLHNLRKPDRRSITFTERVVL